MVRAGAVTTRPGGAGDAGSRFFMLGLLGLAAVAAVLGVLELVLVRQLRPGLNFAFALSLAALLAWTALGGARAAVAEPELARWRRLLEEAQVKGAVAAVDPLAPHTRPRPLLVDLLPDARLHAIDAHAHVGLAVPDASCDAVALGAGVADLPEPTRETLLDEAHRVLRPCGHLVIVVPTTEHRPWPSFAPPQWEPGTPPGWWADALAERFVEIHHAPVSRWYDVLLAERQEAEAPETPTECGA